MARANNTKSAHIQIVVTPKGFLALFTPYSERAVAMTRRIPGRRWDAQRKCNTFPMSAKRAVWQLLCECFPGVQGTGPDGDFTIPGGDAPRQAVFEYAAESAQELGGDDSPDYDTRDSEGHDPGNIAEYIQALREQGL